MDSYSVQAVLSVKDKNFTSTMKTAQSTLSGLDSSTQKSSNSVALLGTAFAVAQKVVSSACNVIQSSVQAAVSRVDTLNQYPKIMEQLGFTSAEAEASINKLSDGIMGLPTSLDTIVESAQSIALVSGNLDEATDVALALNNAFLAAGTSTDVASSATEQYNKMLSTGKVTSQEWQSLQNAMRYTLNDVSEAMGYASDNSWELYYALQSGEVTFDDFNAALVECSEAEGGFAEMAQVASGGIATSWEIVKTAVVRGVADMIQAWNEAAEDNGIPTIQESLNSLRNVIDTVFTAASKAVTVFVNNLDLLLAVCAPVVAGLAAFKIVESVGNMFENCKNKIQESAKVLQEYQSKSETVAAAQEKLKTAEEMAAAAQEKYKSAVDKASSALKQKQSTEQAAETAVQNLKQAEEELTNTTGDRTEAQAKVTEATNQKEAAEKAAAEAAKAYTEASQAQTAADQEKTAAAEYATMAEEEYGTAVQGATIKEIAMSAMSNVMTGSMTLATAATEAFNAAWDANPIGLVIAAITTAITVITAIIKVLQKFGILENTAAKEAKEFKESVEDLTDSVQENRDAMEDNTTSAQNQSSTVNELCSNIVELANQENKSAADTSLLQTYIEQLNNSVDDLGLAYDETTDSLNMATDALLAQAEVDTKTNERAAAQENLTTATEDYLALSNKLEEAQQLEAETADANIVAKQRQKSAVKELEEAQEEQAEVCKQALDEAQAAEEAYTEAVEQQHQLQVDSLQSAIDQEIVTYDQLSEANQSLVDEMSETYQTYVDAILDGNNELSDSYEGTADDIASAWNDTVENNMEVTENWGQNMEALRDRMEGLGYDAAVCDQLEAMGLDGAALVAAFVDASDEELIRFGDDSEAALQTADDTMVSVLDASNVPDSVRQMAEEGTESLRESLNAADWAEVADECVTGLTTELEAGAADANAAGQVVGSQSTGGVATGAETHSPSKATQQTGQDIVEGLAMGLQQSDTAIEAATMLGESVCEAINVAFEEMDFTGMFDALTQAATTAMEQMSAAVTSGMTLVEQAVTGGMQTVSAAMINGFSNMGSSVSSEMSSIASVVSSGMANVSSVMTSGVRGVRSALTEGFSNMSASVTTAMRSVQTAVSSGMSSVTSTMTSGVNNVKQVLTQGFTQMATTTTTQMNKIKTTVTTNMNNIKSTITSSLNSIKSTWSSAMSSIASSTSSGMSRVKSVWQSGMNSIKSMAQSTKSSVISTFNSMYSGMYSAGANAMSGLQAGLNSRRGSVIATAQSIASAVTSTINSALKVGSPSKVLKETGKYAGQGLVNGLKAMLSDVQKISEQMADMVTSIAIGEFDSPKLAFAGMDMSVSYDFGTEDILNRLDSLESAILEDAGKPIQVDTSIGIDGKEVAKATATYTQEQLDKLQARQSRRDKFSISGG